MKKGDILIIAMIVVLAIVGTVYIWVEGLNDTNRHITITLDGEVLYKIKIDDTYEDVIKIDHDGKKNEIRIKNGEVWVESANCLNQVCVKEAPISKSGEVIVCLPHKLIIEIKSKDKTDYDILSE